jgi:hypothetical protein
MPTDPFEVRVPGGTGRGEAVSVEVEYLIELDDEITVKRNGPASGPQIGRACDPSLFALCSHEAT